MLLVTQEEGNSLLISEKGVSVRVIQELARHRDLATTQRYIDVSVDKLRNAVNLVGI